MRRFPVPDPGEPDARSATRYLLWLARDQRSTMAGGMAFGVAWMVSQALMPAAVGRTIDAGITHHDQGQLLRWSGVVLLLGATTAASGILRHRNALSNFLAAGYTTVQVVTRQSVRLGATLPKRVAAGDVVSVGTSDVAEIGGGLDVTARLSGAIVAIIAVAVIMLTTSVPLGMVVLVGVPVLTALTGLLLRPLHERQRHFRTRQGELTARAIDIAAGLRVLRGIGGEAAFAERYRRESQDLRGAALAVTRVESGLAAVEVLMPGIIVSGVTFLATPLRTLMEAADNMTRAHVAARRVVRILSLRAEIEEPERPVSPPVGSVLGDAESGLEIEPGTLFAVVCADPADAETLAARLSRFEDSGQPTLGGTPLADMRVAEVRARVLLARNSDRFFTGTLREELDPTGVATAEEIWTAIDIASAPDVIDALEDGLDSEVVDGGRTFSGGQLQRLRLVRALLARREITILVEPTSAVDAHTEARIAENLAHPRTVSDEGDGNVFRAVGGRGRIGHDGTAGGTAVGASELIGVEAAGPSLQLAILGDRAGSATSMSTLVAHVPQMSPGESVSAGFAERTIVAATTVVFTTSLLLLDRADRVAFIEDGRAVAIGTHRDLLATAPRYAAVVTRGEDEE